MIRINLGCGNKYLPNYINCDISNGIKTDKVFDLNSYPYPFKSNYADEILMDNVLEHLNEIDKVMEETYRILKPGGLLRIYVPYAKSDGAIQDPTHRHFFTEKSMDYFSNKNNLNFYTNSNFEIIKTRLFCDNKTLISKVRAVIPFKNFLKIFLFNIYDGLHFELKALKPISKKNEK